MFLPKICDYTDLSNDDNPHRSRERHYVNMCVAVVAHVSAAAHEWTRRRTNAQLFLSGAQTIISDSSAIAASTRLSPVQFARLSGMHD